MSVAFPKIWNLNSLNDPYVATDKKETADGFLGEWIELDLGEDKVVDGVHIKFRDERTGISNPYFEILDANHDVVYNSSQRCNEKNCMLDLTNGPDAHPRDAGNDRLSDTSAAAARSGREKAFDWDLVVAHHSKWRNEIVIPPYYSVSRVATIGESLAAGNAVKSEEFPLGSTPASVNCSDEGFGIDRNNRTFAPDAKTKACWCRTRGLPVTKRWCDMKSDPAESNFDPPNPKPDLEHPSCVKPFHTVNGRVLVQDEDRWLLIAAYNHQANTNPSLVEGVVPESPTEGFSHVWPGTHLGLTASDIAEVRFYCHTSKHNRVIHFSTKNEWVRNRILVGGSFSGNDVSHWNSGTTKLEGHTGILPDATDNILFGTLLIGEFPFIGSSYHWSIRGGGSRWECDELASPANVDTLHQIWIKLAE